MLKAGCYMPLLILKIGDWAHTITISEEKAVQILSHETSEKAEIILWRLNGKQ